MDKNTVIKINTEEKVSYQGKNYTIRRIVSLSSVILDPLEKGELKRALIKDLQPFIEEKNIEASKVETELHSISNEKWKEAERRYNIIKPILDHTISGKEIAELAKIYGVHYTTLYRWVTKYYRTCKVSALIPDEKSGGRGKSRLTPEQDEIIKATIEDNHLTDQRKPMIDTCEEVHIQCLNAGIDPPHFNTIRNKILALTDEENLRRRYGKKIANYKFKLIEGHFRDTEEPFEVVQIDHTPLDIIVVDEVFRMPIGKPLLTLAIDVYSRMVAGLYISFDPPSSLAAGMCIANAILPKELYLSKLDIKGEWPCYGIMKTIHADNGKEFHGKMLDRACIEYNIKPEWRPVAEPNYGGYIERLLGNFLKRIHTLPGTTFSNTQERKGYNSEKKAVFTITELETWLLTFIVNVYHNKKHKELGMSPLQKYTEGLLGTGTKIGKGLPVRLTNERKVKLDFMPFVERSIQEYGILIDHIHYSHDVLRRWVHATEPDNKKIKRKFIFKRDPRDISVVYFYDPELKQYFDIPYRDSSYPPITYWEYKEILKRLENSGEKHINEALIFEGLKRLREIESSAVSKTKKARFLKKETRRDHSQNKSIKSEYGISVEEDSPSSTIIINEDIKPYENIEDATLI
jgi:putative transposase